MILNYIEQLINGPQFAVLSVLTVLLSVLYMYLKNRDLPPGPTGLPIVGYWPFLEGEKIHVQLAELAKKYGDVFCFNMAGKLLIHLGSVNAIKEAHVAKTDCFLNRNCGFGPTSYVLKEGIGIENGIKWITLRKFFIQAFREYGMASVKEYMTGPIYDSIDASVRDLKAIVGKPINIVPILQAHSLDILRYSMFRNNENMSKEELKALTTKFQKALVLASGRNLLMAGPVAK